MPDIDPDTPAAVLDALQSRTGSPAGRRAADIGAGTGIFSRLLADRGWSVLAVEPSIEMLRRIPAGRLPVSPVCAAAEATGLAAGSVALVTAAQAFHWFNPPYALRESGRILESAGWLALIWNNRDAARSAFAEAFEQLIKHHNPAYQREYRRQDWPGKIAECGLFQPAKHLEFEHEWTLNQEAMVGFSRSVSYIRNVLSRDQMPRFEDDLQALMTEHFGSDPCRIPMRTDLWIARRRPG